MVPVTSSTETTPEMATLTETGVDTGEFLGTIAMGSGAPVASDGVLQTTDGDLVTASHRDDDDGGGMSAMSFDTVTADCQGSEITSVTVGNVTDLQADVFWTTAESTTGWVEWGATPALGNQVSSGNTGTSHGVTLGTFQACGRIYFRVVATDPFGNVSTADSAGAPFEFNAWEVPGILFEDDFETDLGWTLDGEWEIDAPQGLGTAPGDPASAF